MTVEASSHVLPVAERRAADSLACALLLALNGGVLDAFLYLDHGGVFAGAMTGNAVLCSIALLHHDTQDALMHMLPLAAFVVGAWCAFVIESHILHHTVLVALVVEAVCLLIASWLPITFPDVFFIPIVSSMAGFQVASFRTVDRFTYSSTFITGELRSAVEALHTALNPATRRKGLREFRDLSLVVLCFIAGALVGAVLAVRIGNHTLWLPVVLVLAALAMVVEIEIRTERSHYRISVHGKTSS